MPEGCDIPTCGWRAEGDARKEKKGKEKERKEKRSYRTCAAHSNSRGGAGGSLCIERPLIAGVMGEVCRMSFA
eukprot:scaffold5841_cov124-Pinguiococcus_pyrenoidosus.AAC.1